MKNEKVSYGKSFEMFGFWEKVGFEGELEEGETIESALKNYEEKLSSWHKKKYPELYEEKKQASGKLQFKPKPDIEIMKKFMEAAGKGDKATMQLLSNMYEIKKELSAGTTNEQRTDVDSLPSASVEASPMLGDAFLVYKELSDGAKPLVIGSAWVNKRKK